ncbi:MAG: D-alanyl-D-alanine carboxypeptidase family protein, partial [Actinomycetota bacterium]
MKTLRIFLACFAGLLIGSPSAAIAAGPAPAAPPIGSASGILIDASSGKVLWGKEDRTLREPASLTKVLTALVVLENADLEGRVKVSPEAAATRGSEIAAPPGLEMSVKDLLWGLLLESGNDAAVALAEKVSPDGTVGGFMKMANSKAAEIGAENTHFENPHGMHHPSHYSTARDLALITRAAMRNPAFAQMVATRNHTVGWTKGVGRQLTNHHKMLWTHPGTVGVKTGFTNQAGHCLITAVTRGSDTLIAVVLGSPAHYRESAALFDWGFANLPALIAAATDQVAIRQPAPPPGPAIDNQPQIVQVAARGIAMLTGRPSADGIILPAAYAALAVGFTTFAAAFGFLGYAVIVRRRRVARSPMLTP